MKINDFLSTLVRSFYAMQKQRIEYGNRIIAQFKTRLGIDLLKPEEDQDEEQIKILDKLREDYKLLSEAVTTASGKKSKVKFDKLNQPDYSGTDLIHSYAELVMVGHFETLLAEERTFKNLIEDELEKEIIWTDYLKGVKGIGPMMGAIICVSFDIHKAVYPSQFHKYAGLDVVQEERKSENGETVEFSRGRGRFKEHLIKVKYINKKGEEAEKDSITFNPFLKTKLMGVLAPSFIKLNNEHYKAIYKDYKFRLENHPKHKDKTKGHRHQMALRYMVKMFLIDLHIAWRKLEGLPVSTSYAEGKLGLVHKAGPQA